MIVAGSMIGSGLFFVSADIARQIGSPVAIGFARYNIVFFPTISEQNYLIAPAHITSGYAVSLSTVQLVGTLMIALLTWMNTLGLRLGKLVQNIFTVSKTGAVLALIILALLIRWNADAVSSNFGDLWTPRGDLRAVGSGLTAATAIGPLDALCVTQTNPLFAADAWNNIAFTAGELYTPSAMFRVQSCSNTVGRFA